MRSHRVNDKCNNEAKSKKNDEAGNLNTSDDNKISNKKSTKTKKFGNDQIKLKLQIVGLDKQEDSSPCTDLTSINDLELQELTEDSFMVGFELELAENDTIISSNEEDSSSEHPTRIQKIKWSKSTISCQRETSQRIRRLSESEKIQLFIERYVFYFCQK